MSARVYVPRLNLGHPTETGACFIRNQSFGTPRRGTDADGCMHSTVPARVPCHPASCSVAVTIVDVRSTQRTLWLQQRNGFRGKTVRKTSWRGAMRMEKAFHDAFIVTLAARRNTWSTNLTRLPVL